MRWAWAEVDLDALRHNVRHVVRAVAPTEVWAVVKADAYGHGAARVAPAALEAGASGTCVALTQEAVELRDAGITAPIMVLSEQPPEDAVALVAARTQPTLSSTAGVRAIAAAAGQETVDVHVKVDTGMHRAGASTDDVVALMEEIAAHPQLRVASVFSHLAMADEPNAPTNDLQLERFAAALVTVRAAGFAVPRVHVANSAGALALPHSRNDLVRLGIAMYGISPGDGVADLAADLRPVMSLRARVSAMRRVAAGEGVSYGWRHVFDREAVVATVPIGYADGVPRRLSSVGGEVLLHGARRPIVGVVTMDQLMVDVGELDVRVGDEVVLLGRQHGPAGEGAVRAEEWAARLGTIGYEIVCGISKRIERISPPRP